MRAGGSEISVFDSPRPLAAGWFDLEIVLPGPDTVLEPILSVTYEGGEADAVEFALGPARPGVNRYLLNLEGCLKRMTLFAELGSGGSPAGATAKLSPISRIALLRRAAALAPDEVRRAAYWRLLGKKRRSLNILKRILLPPSPIGYRPWLAAREAAWADEIAALGRRHGPDLGSEGVTVVVPLVDGEQPSAATLGSIARQPGSAARVLWASDGATRAERLDRSLQQAVTPWLLVLRNGDELAAGALLRIVAAARDFPRAAVIYGDHDHLDAHDRRRAPHFKPDWNEPLFWARDYLDAAAIHRDRARDAGGFRGDHTGLEVDDLVLRLAGENGDRRVAHVPRVLHHARVRAYDRHESAPERARMVQRHLALRDGRVRTGTDAYRNVRVDWPLSEPPPLVSLIVPTRDAVELLRPCIEGLRHRTTYPALEILIADNGSREKSTHDYFASLAADTRVHVLPMPGPFNFAAINNAAVRAAKGSVIGFINNDIEVIEPCWLSGMVGWALRPGIGAVGARLLYATQSVQHAGVIVGLNGIAGHAHRYFPADHSGYTGRLQAAHHVSAVTAACLVVERAKFEAAGGFDAAAFPVALNDVDLCLKLGQLGFESLYTPYAALLHKESATRAHDLSAARRRMYAREVDEFQTRWRAVIGDDPCYSLHLTREDESFSLA